MSNFIQIISEFFKDKGFNVNIYPHKKLRGVFTITDNSIGNSKKLWYDRYVYIGSTDNEVLRWAERHYRNRIHEINVKKYKHVFISIYPEIYN